MRSLRAFALRRLLSGVLLVGIASASAMTLVHLAPGDAATELELSGASPGAAEAARARLGLNRPFSDQFATWAGRLARFDLGTSSNLGRPVRQLLGERAASTAILAGTALALATMIGVPLGLLTGSRPRGLLALAVAPLSIALVSCPPIVGALALLLFGSTTGWLSVSPGHLAVPALALALPLAAMLERLQSRATADVIGAPDIRAAAARGIPASRLVWRHALRQSLRPLLGLYGVVMGSLFGGSLAVEVVTSWPGLGRLMYEALVHRDLPLVAGCALAGAVFLAAGNFLADLAAAWVDPRVAEGIR